MLASCVSISSGRTAFAQGDKKITSKTEKAYLKEIKQKSESSTNLTNLNILVGKDESNNSKGPLGYIYENPLED